MFRLMSEFFFIDALSNLPYLGIFLFAIFSGYIVPIPEEIILLIVGFMASAGIVHPFPATIILMVAFILGDNILYRLVLKNNKLVTTLINEVLSLKIITKHREFFEKHIRWAIFITRFIPFMRFVGPVFAGYMKVREKTFMTFNTLAIILYTSFLMWVDYSFHSYFARIVDDIMKVRHMAIILIWIVVGFIITRILDYVLKKSNIK